MEIDSTVYPLLTLFKLLKIKPDQKVDVLVLLMLSILVVYLGAGGRTNTSPLFGFPILRFDQAEFTPEELNCRKRLLDIEVCTFVIFFTI